MQEITWSPMQEIRWLPMQEIRHHATERQKQRGIIRPEILFVLRHGHHEKKKDKFGE